MLSLEKCHLINELEDFVACGETFTRFRDHRSMPLTGGFGRMKFDQVEKIAEQKCKKSNLFKIPSYTTPLAGEAINLKSLFQKNYLGRGLGWA